MRTTVVMLALLTSSGLSSELAAQGLEEIMAGIRNGGGWVAIPIEAGKGSFSTVPIPTLNLTLTGCLQVWEGHSGRWDIRARDTIGQGLLETSSVPGEGVRFTHKFGLRSQLEIEFTWSEPRDTTLTLWVGLEGGTASGGRDACTPPTDR